MANPKDQKADQKATTKTKLTSEDSAFQRARSVLSAYSVATRDVTRAIPVKNEGYFFYPAATIVSDMAMYLKVLRILHKGFKPTNEQLNVLLSAGMKMFTPAAASASTTVGYGSVELTPRNWQEWMLALVAGNEYLHVDSKLTPTEYFNTCGVEMPTPELKSAGSVYFFDDGQRCIVECNIVELRYHLHLYINLVLFGSYLDVFGNDKTPKNHEQQKVFDSLKSELEKITGVLSVSYNLGRCVFGVKNMEDKDVVARALRAKQFESFQKVFNDLIEYVVTKDSIAAGLVTVDPRQLNLTWNTHVVNNAGIHHLAGLFHTNHIPALVNVTDGGNVITPVAVQFTECKHDEDLAAVQPPQGFNYAGTGNVPLLTAAELQVWAAYLPGTVARLYDRNNQPFNLTFGTANGATAIGQPCCNGVINATNLFEFHTRDPAITVGWSGARIEATRQGQTRVIGFLRAVSRVGGYAWATPAHLLAQRGFSVPQPPPPNVQGGNGPPAGGPPPPPPAAGSWEEFYINGTSGVKK